MSKKIFYAEVASPKPSANWLSLSDIQRIERLNEIIDQNKLGFNTELLIVAAKKDGQVVVRLLKPLIASVRGTILLDLEEYIKKNVDQGLAVWGEALGDKSSLRNLRGIEVKVS